MEISGAGGRDAGDRGGGCGHPRKELERVRRILAEYGLSGWDMAYILPSDKDLHDRMKKKEEKQMLLTGY